MRPFGSPAGHGGRRHTLAGRAIAATSWSGSPPSGPVRRQAPEHPAAPDGRACEPLRGPGVLDWLQRLLLLLTAKNDCPDGTFPGGWWYACVASATYATGSRYYLDCVGYCREDCGACLLPGRPARAPRVLQHRLHELRAWRSPALPDRALRHAPLLLWPECSSAGAEDPATSASGPSASAGASAADDLGRGGTHGHGRRVDAVRAGAAAIPRRAHAADRRARGRGVAGSLAPGVVPRPTRSPSRWCP